MNHIPSILVVEDDRNLSNLIAELLVEAGYKVYAVGTGAKARAQLDATVHDLVILDWMLPDIQGVLLCQTIKSLYQKTFLPVLMLTARSALADRVAGFEAGADDYLTKPFHADELVARVRALLRIRVAEVERSRALEELENKHQALLEAYEQLQRTQSQLVQASKLAALGELVAGVAHELNNPLAVILGNAELLPNLQDEEDRRAVEHIIAGAQRARKVVQSLLMFARHGQMEADWHEPVDLIGRVLDLKAAVLRSSGVTLEVEFDPNLPLMCVDGPQIQQVLLNLLTNAEQALEHTPDPRIVIRAFMASEPIGPPPILPDRAPSCPLSDDQHLFVIDIADNGTGIDQQFIDRIFEPFVTTKPIGKGTGLGLAISYGIVAQHGGTLQVSSKPDRGTTFRVAVPVKSHADMPEAHEIEQELAVGNGHILVIDDEPEIVDLVDRFLARQGYVVTGVSSAAEALQLLQQHPYDTILCDIKMPDMDGMMFYQHLQTLDIRYRPHLIVMTGDTSSDSTAAFLQQNALPVLHKPFAGRELLEMLSSFKRERMHGSSSVSIQRIKP